MKTTIITFSPTGGTLKCAIVLAQNIGEIVQEIDLTVKRLDDYTLSPESNLAILALPSYGGRVPTLAAERLKKIDGQGKPAVLLVVYGNRAFEDTLVEMEDIAKAQGFNVIAAVAAIAQHCMDERIATSRPDTEDLAKLKDFARQIAEKVTIPFSMDNPQPVLVQCPAVLPQGVIPGNRPYKKAGSGMQPTTDKTCTACGLCAKNCPAGAISIDDPTKIDSNICLGCMRCVALCPSKSKRLTAAKRLLVHTFLSLTAGKRKEPELYI